MTAPLRWPKNAEAHRIESLACAGAIIDLGAAAKDAIWQGKRELATAYVADMQRHAKEIETRMRLAKYGEPER